MEETQTQYDAAAETVAYGPSYLAELLAAQQERDSMKMFDDDDVETTLVLPRTPASVPAVLAPPTVVAPPVPPALPALPSLLGPRALPTPLASPVLPAVVAPRVPPLAYDDTAALSRSDVVYTVSSPPSVATKRRKGVTLLKATLLIAVGLAAGLLSNPAIVAELQREGVRVPTQREVRSLVDEVTPLVSQTYEKLAPKPILRAAPRPVRIAVPTAVTAAQPGAGEDGDDPQTSGDPKALRVTRAERGF